MDPQAIRLAPYVAIMAIIGFFILAFILLYPVYRFINREEELSKDWTPEELARRGHIEHHGTNGVGASPDDAAAEPPKA